MKIDLNLSKEQWSALASVLGSVDSGKEIAAAISSAVNPKKIINLTPHDVVIVDDAGTEIKRLPHCSDLRDVTRIYMERTLVDVVDGIQIYAEAPEYDVSALPDEMPNTYYVVSRAVAYAVNREDLLVPKDVVRDASGAILGCKGLMRI